jgi:hypothetical protein
MSEEIPVFRRLRGYAFDPSLSVQLDTAFLNEAIFKVTWEKELEAGPIGEYLEVIDYDPASQCFYAPINLNHPFLLAKDGLVPSESDPQFHQQMVYAVAMTTIQNFERALGRKTLWSSYRKVITDQNGIKVLKYPNDYIQRLRIYPHALREANAYYSPLKKALLFGYFPASGKIQNNHIPGTIVFTCLSHDIIAHETTHALLDGIHRRFIEANHPDSLAFHEAFADIVALFQHFTFPEVLRHQIAKTRGDLTSQNLLGELAQQFGKAIGHYGALRDAIGKFNKETGKWNLHKPDPIEYQTIDEPHARGAILVSAVFEAFLSIYKRRVADLLRIATSGTGVLPEGELHPDLVNRLAHEASKTAQHILNICIRALDYCPPVDINFGDYLRALITADADLVPNDDRGYRIALVEAFRRRGIFPRDVRTLSEQSLCWDRIAKDAQKGIFKDIAERMRSFLHWLDYLDEYPSNLENYPSIDNFPEQTSWQELPDREKIFHICRAARIALHDLLVKYKAEPATLEDIKSFEEITGLYLLETYEKQQNFPEMRAKNGKYIFEIHLFREVHRVSPEGTILNQVIISITQKCLVPLDEQPEKTGESETFEFRGGCTMILDLRDLTLKRIIKKRIDDRDRLNDQRRYRTSEVGSFLSLRNTYFGNSNNNDEREPFAFLHRRF